MERGEQGMDTRVRIHRTPKTLITGNGCISRIGDEARKLGATKVCVLTDPGAAELHQVGTLPVAVSRGAFGIDRHGPVTMR